MMLSATQAIISEITQNRREKMNKIELGWIDLSDKVVVSDPCYNRDTWCMRQDIPVLPGRYQVHIIMADEGEFGHRVASLVAVHEKYPITHQKQWRVVDEEIGVDSGQCGIFDDSAYPDLTDAAGREAFYDECCNITLSKKQAGILHNGKGALSSSGYGDGSYRLSGVSHRSEYVALMLDYSLASKRAIMELLVAEQGPAAVDK